MKAFLLAGGLGERLRPLTDRMPKCLAPINGEPLLAIWLDLCARHGVDEVLINVCRHADVLQRFLEQRTWNLRLRVVHEANPVGSAGTVLANREFVAGDDDFFILYTDNLTDVALDQLAAFHRSHDGPLTIGLFRTPSPRASGIVDLGDGGLITGFEEKPAAPTSDLANAGIYVARQSLFADIPARGEVVDFARDVFPRLVNRMRGFIIEDFLMDIGNPAALAEAARLWETRRNHASDGRMKQS
jgi:mannose-1-phosphate guanylyltransferase